MDADDPASGLTPVGFETGWNAYPAWSPDGRRIAFTSDWRAYDTLFDVYVANTDGSEPELTVAGPFFWVDGLKFYFQPAWSPDGNKLAMVFCTYAWHNCYPESSIAVAKADGSGLTILEESGGMSHPTWAPDGSTIAFSTTSCDGCDVSIRYMNTDGGKSKLVVANGYSPAWRP